MELEQIHKKLKESLKESRYVHSTGVEEVAHDLAIIYGCNERQAVLAGILHDCAKCLSDEALLQECRLNHLPITDVEVECPFLLHAKVGALYARIKYGIEEKEILNAITYHTTGRPGMSILEKIIFVSDYIEPYRRPLPRIEEIRKTVYQNLDQGVYLVLENMVQYLENSGSIIDQTTTETYQYYKKILNIL